MVKLWLDDIRFAPDETWAIVRDYWEAINWLEKNGCPDVISFDHDISSFDGEKEYTGRDVAGWMVEKDLDNESEWLSKNFEWRIHSANPVGRENIESILKGYLNFKDKT